jgi:predicted restriction endonuclease
MKLPDATSSRAVIIGTSHHKMMPSLPAVTNNVTALQGALCSQDIWGLPPQNCEVVCDPVSSIEMLDAVGKAAQGATDTLLFYFAGHGIADQRGELHLSLCETDPQRIYTAVKYESVLDLISASRAKRRVIILDCCYSGRALGSMSDGVSALIDEASVEGTYILAAAPNDKKALSPPEEEYTAFTGELLNIIQYGIAGGGELLDLDTIFNHVREVMRERRLPTPQKRDRNTAGQLTLVRNRAYGAKKRGIVAYGRFHEIDIGTIFPNRKALHDARVHRPLQAGICGTADQGGAESIVVSGGYKDDVDYGDTIIYTGHGGRDPNTGIQIKDQEPTDSGNAALLQNIITGMPVRVIRGAGGDPRFSPPSGYSYDGLFSVEEYWSKPGIDGPRILQFRLESIDDESVLNGAHGDAQTRYRHSRSGGTGELAPNQWERVARGIYRDRRISERVLRSHDFECQVCGIYLEAPGGGRYARAVHLRGLNLPHNGPDVPENILCLCPNHCALFEFGSLTIDDKLQVIDEITNEIVGDLRTNKKHQLDHEYVRYHRELHRLKPPGEDGSLPDR